MATAADGGAALAAVERFMPDVVVLDVMMPGLDGLAVARRLRRRSPTLPILLLTARDAVRDRAAGLDSGADDYLVKPFASEELSARVRALLRRGTEPGERLSFADVTFDVDLRSGRGLELTPREADLLELFLSQPRRVVTRDMALERVWGETLAASPGVVTATSPTSGASSAGLA